MVHFTGFDWSLYEACRLREIDVISQDKSYSYFVDFMMWSVLDEGFCAYLIKTKQNTLCNIFYHPFELQLVIPMKHDCKEHK